MNMKDINFVPWKISTGFFDEHQNSNYMKINLLRVVFVSLGQV